MNIKIESKYLNLIKNIINSILQDKNLKIYVFGSRAKGNARQYSDLDVALKSDSKIDVDKINKIKIGLDDTTIPYKIDVIDLNEISDSFKSCIEKSLIEI
jgi:uncharacterized protein